MILVAIMITGMAAIAHGWSSTTLRIPQLLYVLKGTHIIFLHMQSVGLYNPTTWYLDIAAFHQITFDIASWYPDTILHSSLPCQGSDSPTAFLHPSMSWS